MSQKLGDRHPLRRGAMLSALLAGAWLAPASAQPLTVLTIDAEYLQSTMPLYQTIAAQAAKAQQGTDSLRRSDLDLARDLRQSEVLTALPEAIAEVARAAQADLVIDRAVARRIEQPTARDITSEVEKILVAKFGELPLEPGS